MKAHVVVGLGFGDEGKGSIVDYLVRRHDAGMVVRFNGGAQAAHHVVSPDGREHVFAQFGAGTLSPGVRTHLGANVVVNPLNLLREEKALREIGVTDALPRLTIDRQALIVTPFQVAVNRAREEARGWKRHGSCGQGIGEARSDQIAGRPILLAGHLGSRSFTLNKLLEIRDSKRAELEEIGATDWLERPEFGNAAIPSVIMEHYWRLRANLVVEEWMPHRHLAPFVFEGAQGVLLDEYWGFHPHNTWTDTTSAHAETLLDQWDIDIADRQIVGVMRAYQTRHGAGPLPTYSTRLSSRLTDPMNEGNAWQGAFRVGYPDLVLLDYALRAQHVDRLAVTCMDRIKDARLDAWKVCPNYVVDGRVIMDIPSPPPAISKLPGRVLERAWPELKPMGRTMKSYREVLPKPVSIFSHGPTAEGKVEE